MFTIAFFSCFKTGNRSAGLQAAISYGASVFVSQGDAPYCNTGSNSWGYTTSAVDKDTTIEEFSMHHDQHYANPDVLAAIAKYKYYVMGDDHEWGGDNFDHTITQANSQTSIGAVTQADVDNHWDAGNQALGLAISAYADNPVNADPDAIADIPSESVEVDATNYPVRYFREGFNVNGVVDNVNPHVELFVIDCISYRSPIADIDNSSKTMLGVHEKAWLKAQLLASTATFKPIFSGKKTYKTPTNDNTDTFGEYTTERDEILQFIKDNAITGVIWLSGDRHFPHVIKTEEPTDSFDHYCIAACPIGVETNSIGTANEVKWSQDANVVGLLNIHKNDIEPMIVDCFSRRVLYKGRLPAGSNKDVREILSVSI